MAVEKRHVEEQVKAVSQGRKGLTQNVNESKHTASSRHSQGDPRCKHLGVLMGISVSRKPAFIVCSLTELTTNEELSLTNGVTMIGSSLHAVVSMLTAAESICNNGPDDVYVTGTFYGAWVDKEWPVSGIRYGGPNELYLFAAKDGSHVKLVGVSLAEALESSTPSTPVSKYVTVESVPLTADTVIKMWESRYVLDGKNYPTNMGSDEKGYEIKDVKVVGCETGTTTTAAVTADPAMTALHERILSLETSLSGSNSVADLKAALGNVSDAVAAVETTISSEMTRVDAELRTAKMAAANSTRQLKTADARIDTLVAQVSELRSMLTAFMTKPTRSSPRPIPADCSKGVCPPAASGDNDNLALEARGGSVTFETAGCPPTELCDLALDVQALLSKFPNE